MAEKYDYLRTEPAGPVHVRLVAYSLDRAPEENAEVVLDLGQVLELVRNLLASIDPDSIAREHLTGNCPVCQNTRTVLVHVRGPDSPGERVACRACNYRSVKVPHLLPYGKVK